MADPLRHSLQHRLRLAFLALAVLPLLAAMSGNAWLFFRHHGAAEHAHVREITLRVAREVEDALRVGEGALERMLDQPDASALDDMAREALLVELLARQDSLTEATWWDAAGRMLARASMVRVVGPEPAPPSEIARRALADGNVRYGPIRFAEEDGAPGLELAMPTRERVSGRVDGVVVVDMRLRGLWSLIARLTLEPGVEVYVLDDAGAVVAHRNPSVVLRGSVLPGEASGTRAGLTGRRAYLAERVIWLGQRPLRVVVERDWRVAIEPALQGLAVLVLVLLLTLALAMAAGANALRRIVQPVREVGETARAIAAGDTMRRVPVRADDEIGELARAFNDMTDRLQESGRRLGEKEALLREVLESLPVGVWVMDAEGVIRQGNSEGRRIWAGAHYVGPEQFGVYKGWWLDTGKAIAAEEWAAARAIRDGVSVLGEEIQIECFDGSRKIILNSALPLRDPATGAVAGAIIVNQDITARKLAEAEWNYAMDFFDEAVYLLDLGRRVVRANRAFLRMTGLRADQAIGRPIVDIVHPGGEDEPCPVCRAQIERRDAVITLEADHPANPLGAPIEVVSCVIRAPGGEATGILMSIRDLSRARRTEERLRQAITVFNNTQEGIMVVDPERHIVAVNPAFSEITGYGEDEVRGKDPNLLASGRHGRDFYRAMWTALRDGGRWQGEIWNRRKNGEIYPQWLTISAVANGNARLTGYVGVFTDISEAKRSQAQLEFLAHHDPLTGLPNRLLLRARLEHGMEEAAREGSQLALLFLDLDRFKDVNDSLGHSIGDELLCEVARRLRDVVRREDTVARLGGDEFTVLLEHLKDGEDAARLARKLLDRLMQPYLMGERTLYLGASIGISLYPRDCGDVESLLRNADAAMYRAKESGRNTYQFYALDMTRHALERVEMEARLREGIGGGPLMVYYQPQVRIADGGIAGIEALVRWRHPELGMVPPDRFIRLAEDTGLILPLGAWVLRAACAQAAAWHAAGLDFGRVAVNVAARQVRDGDLVNLLREVLHETGLPAPCLELEITESSLTELSDATVSLLQGIRALGVTLAIDDFGTGFSSLSYLKRLPVQKLKIDKSFVTGLPQDDNDAAIARAVLALGHSLRFSVIAEGVETQAQRDFLHAEGCAEAQGFLYARPMPAAQVEPLLRRGVLACSGTPAPIEPAATPQTSCAFLSGRPRCPERAALHSRIIGVHLGATLQGDTCRRADQETPCQPGPTFGMFRADTASSSCVRDCSGWPMPGATIPRWRTIWRRKRWSRRWRARRNCVTRRRSRAGCSRFSTIAGAITCGRDVNIWVTRRWMRWWSTMPRVPNSAMPAVRQSGVCVTPSQPCRWRNARC